MTLQTSFRNIRDKIGLSGNQLKILAAIFMTIDHAAFYLLNDDSPIYYVLRGIGRLAFPMFAFFIAEGCVHSKNRLKYLLTMAVFAVGAEIVYGIVNVPYMSVFMTFTLGIIAVYIYDGYTKIFENGEYIQAFMYFMLLIIYLAAVLFVNGFVKEFEYGFGGILIILLCYVFKNKMMKMTAYTFGNIFVAISSSMPILQLCSIASVPLMLLYNGKRGKRKMKYFFYIFYPAHVLIIILIGVLIAAIKQLVGV